MCIKIKQFPAKEKRTQRVYFEVAQLCCVIMKVGNMVSLTLRVFAYKDEVGMMPEENCRILMSPERSVEVTKEPRKVLSKGREVSS